MIMRHIGIALRSLWRVKLRTGLSTLSVALGLGIVLLVLSSSLPFDPTMQLLPEIVLYNTPFPIAILAGMTLLMSIVVAMSLGVLSVMERRSEISIRRIYGATKRHIFIQILLEMIVVVVFGSILGVAGVGVVFGIWSIQNITVVGLGNLLLLFVLITTGGIAAGIPPALQAIRCKLTESQ